jgi:hypothetical protein
MTDRYIKYTVAKFDWLSAAVTACRYINRSRQTSNLNILANSKPIANILGYKSGSQVGSFDEKTKQKTRGCVESRATVTETLHLRYF